MTGEKEGDERAGKNKIVGPREAVIRLGEGNSEPTYKIYLCLPKQQKYDEMNTKHQPRILFKGQQKCSSRRKENTELRRNGSF